MHYFDHILECPIGPSLKVVQLRRLFDWTNMAAPLPRFFGAARHPCFEVSDSEVRKITHTFSIKKLISQQPFIRFFPFKVYLMK